MEKIIQQNLSTQKAILVWLTHIDDRLKLRPLRAKIVEDEIYDALKADLNKTKTETMMSFWFMTNYT